jgi:hypothetical protein
MLATDGYTISSGNGFNMQTYFVDGDTLGVLKDKKDDVKVLNLENFVGGGESIEYDLIGIKNDVDVLFIKEEKNGKKRSVFVSLEKGANIDKTKEILSNEFKKLQDEYEVEISLNTDLAIFETLEELEKSISENDFAKRVFSDDGIEFVKSYFNEMEK